MTPEFLLRYRGGVKFLLHLGIFGCAYLFAYLIRFEFSIPAPYPGVIRDTIVLLLVAKTLAFLAFGLFRGWWRYMSLRDVFPIAAGCSSGTILFAASVYLLQGPYHVPPPIYVLDWGNTLFLVLAARYLSRVGRETLGRRQRATDRKVLIVGAGSAGQMIAREIRENLFLGLIATGFVDDDREKIGTRIKGLRVLGDHDRIGEICRDHAVEEIIIAIPSAPPSVIHHIVEHCRTLPARFRIIPGVREFIGGKAGVNALRNVNLADLLGRTPVPLDATLLHRGITGHTIMVTGAAGSIGSELCRQMARLSPSRLVLFEIAETPLFELELELREEFPALDVVAAMGDIRDRQRVEEVIAACRPAVIYHAAAYKHVPVMEMHPCEAVKTNVFGTRVVAEAAARYNVQRFVLVSTDKAVRPTSVMGATKRVTELFVQNMNGLGRATKYVSVRFGNVLDSSGSVIPIFRRQMETTGRLTVTHPEASRYFMLNQEAAGLILQAGAMGEGGEVFVLDMGEPIKIVDLARNMIRLSGKELGQDAEIVFTGLRPGEKLREELVVEGEDVVRTSHRKVMKLIGNGPMPPGWFDRLERLVAFSLQGDRMGVIEELDGLVKGYVPDYKFHREAASTMEPASSIPSLRILSSPVPPSKSIH